MTDIFKSWLVETPIAHRGLHNDEFPENSIGAFKNAVKSGYAIELDVQIISDGTVVVFHDESLSRMTGNDGYIKFLTKQDLPMLKLGSSKETIPTLSEALEAIAGEMPVIIEIKNNAKVGGLEQKVIDILSNYKGQYAVASFNPLSLAYFKQHAPSILRGQLAGFLKNIKMKFITRWGLKRMALAKKTAGADFIMYEAKTLPNRFVKKFKKLPLLAWTVKSQEEYLRVVKYCDNVIFEGFDPKI